MGHVSRTGLIEALRRLWQPLVFAALMGIAYWWFVTIEDVAGIFGFDFRGTLWEAARMLAEGNSPYPAPASPELTSGNPALYPPFAIAAAIPLTWLPWSVAVGVWFVILISGAMGGTWLLGVRDWRCYCVVLTSLPLLYGLLYGNLSLLLLLGVGAVWHFRDRRATSGLALGTIVAAKLFLWPLVVWALLQRRFAASLWAVGVALCLVLVPWALIGFEDMREYPALLRAAADLYGPHSNSLVAAGTGAGLPLGIALTLPPLAAVFLLVLAAIASRRDDGDRRAFALAVLAAIASSPIVWNYYLVLLAAPIAVMRPRLSWLWLALPATYVIVRLPGGGLTGSLHSSPPLGQSLGVAALLALLALLALALPFHRPGQQ